MKQPYVFGIRHLSPAGAWHLRAFLEEKQPRLVLVEGPSDLNDQMDYLTAEQTKPPIAILAYTKEAPIRTLLYPLAQYSPEYQAFLWCKEHGVPCRFMDLPSDVFLGIPEKIRREAQDAQVLQDVQGEEGRQSVYALLERQSHGDGTETFWERTMERSATAQGYWEGARLFGQELRAYAADTDEDYAENIVRESYMRRQLSDAIGAGYAPEEIVAVTGAFHVEGLLSPELLPMSDEEIGSLPRTEVNQTLMPYSYYRLSARSGYGAGNKAPAYYELLWEGLQRNEPMYAAYRYLSQIAAYQRKNGNPTSSAAVLEAVRLASALASMRGTAIPSLRDLQDAAVTCIGEGSLSSISLAVADTEIGTAVGMLPEGVSRTSIQEDFYRKLGEYKLEKYKSAVAQDLALDLRENRRAATQQSAFLDLNRSFFLHRLRVLQIHFAHLQSVRQDNATWAEHWVVCWSAEAEIELVEAALKGDTVEQAVSFQMKEQTENATDIGQIAAVIEDAFTCGMASSVRYAISALQALAVDAVSIEGLACTVNRLSTVISYGSIRQLDAKPLEPVLAQMFYRACLLLPESCICDDAAAKGIIEAMEQLNAAALAHSFLDGEAWIAVLYDVAERDDCNTMLSGYAMAVLLERSCIDAADLKREVQRRLSKGIPAELGAGWFQGLSMKNHYALITRLSLWENLNSYLEEMDDEEFKRALIFLRRAFVDFTPQEKDAIAENLGEIWGLNGQQVSETVNQSLGADEAQMIESLEDFDFDL